MSTWDDERNRHLIEEIQAGKRYEENTREIYERNHAFVARFYHRLGFTAEECRDLTQDVFVRVYTGIDGFAGQSSFRTWLQTIALNLYRNEIRRRKTAKRDQVEKSIDDRAHGEDPLEIKEAAPGPYDLLIDKERLLMVGAVVESMPEQMQTCFRLRYDHEYKYREIAGLMKISIETVKAHLHQARERLKKQLPDLGTDEPEE